MPALMDRAMGMGEEGVKMLKELVALKNSEDVRLAALEFNRALARLQGRLPKIFKDKAAKIEGTSSGSSFKYKWATSENIVETVRPIAAEEGFSFTFDMEADATSVVAVLRLKHELGHEQSNKVRVPVTSRAGMSDQQKVGSAREHAKRYAMADAFGLVFTEAQDEGEMDPTPISTEQAHTIIALAKEVNVSGPRFLKKFNITKVSELTVGQYDEAVRILEQLRKEGQQ
jgi:hypothetical protein